MINLFVVLLLFILPLIVFQFGISPYETPKIFVAQLIVFIFAIYSILTQKDFFAFPKDKVIFYALVGVCILLLIQIVVFRESSVVFGDVYRFQGLFFMFTMLIFSYVSARTRLTINPLYIFSLLVVHLILAFFLGTNEAHRSFGTLGEPNSLASYSLFLWPFILFDKKRLHKVFQFSTIFIVIGILYISGSRSALFALLAQSTYLGLLYKNIPQRLSVVAAVVVLSLSLLSPFFVQTYYENRADIWKGAFQAGITHPIIGSGFGNIHSAISHTRPYKITTLQNRIVDSAHNIFLDWWVQGGIVGFLLLVTMLTRTFIIFVKQKNKLYITLLVGLLGTFLFNPMSVSLHLCLWFLIGQALSKNTAHV